MLKYYPTRAGYGVSFSFAAPPAHEGQVGDEPDTIATSLPPFDSDRTSSLYREEPVSPVVSATLNPIDHEVETAEGSCQDEAGGGGHNDDSPPDPLYADFAASAGVFACVASGSLLACAGLVPGEQSWHILKRTWRQFHLAGSDQADLRLLAKELYEFTKGEGIGELAFCRTQTGSLGRGLDDEVRLESLIMMIPRLVISRADNNVVADWALRENPPSPENMPEGRLGFAQIRAVELAQFTLTHAPLI